MIFNQKTFLKIKPIIPGDRFILKTTIAPGMMGRYRNKLKEKPSNSNGTSISTHSVLRLSTGFVSAAFIVWKITVSNVIANTIIADIINGKTDKPVL